jgi:hypothetical protein
LGRIALECEISSDQSHKKRSANILEDGVERERRAKPSRETDVDGMSESGADAAANKHDEICAH